MEELLSKHFNTQVLQCKTRGIIVFCKDMYKYIHYEVEDALIHEVITDIYGVNGLYQSLGRLIIDLETMFLETNGESFEIPPEVLACVHQLNKLSAVEPTELIDKEKLIEDYRKQQEDQNMNRTLSEGKEGKTQKRKGSTSTYNRRISKIDKSEKKVRAQSPKD